MGMSTANRLLPSHVRKTGLLKFSAVKMVCTKTLLADQSTATRRMQITPTVQDVTFHSRKGDILHVIVHNQASKVSHLTL
jgi:ABC-type polysaccharide/polyol phosphate transport system ATPase subunit